MSSDKKRSDSKLSVQDGKAPKHRRIDTGAAAMITIADIAMPVFTSGFLHWYEAVNLSQVSRGVYEIWTSDVRNSYPDFTNLLSHLNVMCGTNKCSCEEPWTHHQLLEGRCAECGEQLQDQEPMILSLYGCDPRLRESWSGFSGYVKCKKLVKHIADLVSCARSYGLGMWDIDDDFLDKQTLPGGLDGGADPDHWALDQVNTMERRCPGLYTFFMKAYSLSSAQHAMESSGPDFFNVLLHGDFGEDFENVAGDMFLHCVMPRLGDTEKDIKSGIIYYIRLCYPSESSRQILGPSLVGKLHIISPYFDYVPLDEEDGDVSWPTGCEKLTKSTINAVRLQKKRG